MSRDYTNKEYLAFSEEHCWHSRVLSQSLFGKRKSELSTPVKLSLRPSFAPIQLGLQAILLELLHSHFTNFIHGWTQTKPTAMPAATQNETGGNASPQNHYQTLPIVYSFRASNDIRATDLLLNTIIMLPHIVYKLYIAVLFIYTKKAKTQPTRTSGADCPDEREIR